MRGPQLGFLVERLVADILTCRGVAIGPRRVIYPEEGYIRPDICLEGDRFIEITKWGDSNKLCSILTNGFLVKKKIRRAKYYAVVAGYHTGNKNWTWDPDVDFYLGQCSRLFSIRPLDGYFGFGDIDGLVRLLGRDVP
jgi:hypothetical protein